MQCRAGMESELWGWIVWPDLRRTSGRARLVRADPGHVGERHGGVELDVAGDAAAAAALHLPVAVVGHGGVGERDGKSTLASSSSHRSFLPSYGSPVQARGRRGI